MSFFFLLRSFFIDKEENHLFENIVSFELYVSIILLYVVPVLEKREVHSNTSLFAKSVSLFYKKM